MSDDPKATEGLNLAKLRRLASQMRKDVAAIAPYGFRGEAVLAMAGIIEECTPAEPKPGARKRLAELRVVVDYDLPDDEIRVGPGAFSQLQSGLLEADMLRWLK